ncbi:MAG: cytochrome C oxidase subunit IV family protein [Planctomycetes bacterium]|nr:cytochrome C oxidase subunit IV family protein [Planctomycetota bacterium]
MSEAHAESHLPTYRKVIITLTVLTAVEFGISFAMHSLIPFVLGLLLLVGLAFYKASLVGRFFMHIKYDPSIFAFLCVLPLILGSPIILLVGYDLVHGPNF